MNLEEKVLTQIKNNKLENEEYSFVIAQICVLNNKSYSEMKMIVDNLIAAEKIMIKGAEKIEKITDFDNKKVKTPYGVNRKGNKNFKFEKHGEWDENLYSAHEILDKKNKKKERKIIRVQGKIQATLKGYAFLLPFDATIEDIFIPEKELNGAMHNDTVVVEAVNTNNYRKEGKVTQIVERGCDKIIGKISISKKGAYVTPDDVKLGKDIFVPINKILNAKNGDKVHVKIERFYNKSKCPDGIVMEVLGEPNKIETEVLAIIRNYDLYENFPKNVQEYVSKFEQEINKVEQKNRLDLTRETIFTIDGEDARDLDDAISLTVNKNGNRVLGVHIADVGEYVKTNSPVDKEAFKRGTSVYFPNTVLPMLPRELSNGICSLNEREERLTLSLFIEYDENANVLNYEIKETIIESKKRFTYTEVQKIILNDIDVVKKNGNLSKIIIEMNKLAKQLDKRRQEKGCIEFNIPEVKVSLNKLGDVLNVEKQIQDESHKLIECFMVAANEIIAEHFYKLKLPFVYRIHENPDAEKISKFLTLVRGLGISTTANEEKIKPIDILKILQISKNQPFEYVVNRICLRSMKKAKYSQDCLGHFGLGSKYYCHFTSPIRRYPDLTIHRIIKDWLHGTLNGKLLSETRHFVVASSYNSTEREIVADKCERDVDDLYKVFYMSYHVGEEFEGIINSITKFGVYVMLENTVEGLVKFEELPADNYNFENDFYKIQGNHSEFVVGQKIQVKVLRADILTRQIDFMLV